MTLVAEWIKLVTTRSLWWSAVIAALLSLGFAAMAPISSGAGAPPAPERTAIGVATFAVPVLMILAATTVTGEYRTGLIRATFLATPNRSRVLVAKAFLAAAVAGSLAAALTLAAILLAGSLAAGGAGIRLASSDAGSWRQVGAIGVYAALAAVLAVGLATMVRHAAGVIAVLLLLQFVAEPLLAGMPRIGKHVSPLLPFGNAFTFTETPWLHAYAMWWGPQGALLYFTAVVAVVFLGALWSINRRDP